jgi:hypothetical protein
MPIVASFVSIFVASFVAIFGICGSGCSSPSGGTPADGTGGAGGAVSGAGGWMGPAPLPCDAFAAGAARA